MNSNWQRALGVVSLLSMLVASPARADLIVEWNVKACDIVAEAKLPPPPATRTMAIVQTAVYEAANAVTGRYPARLLQLKAEPGASLEAAVAAANRVTLSQLMPAQAASVDAAYQAAIAAIPDGAAKTAGIAVGEKAAAEILARAAADGMSAAESYRPATTPGVYVPTVIPVATQFPQRKPWIMAKADQFRPGPPPALKSETWARDYNEIRQVGSRNSTSRTAEQTAIARFWEARGPSIYHGLIRSVANMPGRDAMQNARLFAAAAQAADDALISIFDAKYHYAFWRPVTAIRNGDQDGNDATERDPSWTPFIETPMHPEYPCAHCVSAGAIGTVLKAEIGDGPAPVLTTTSDAVDYAARSWKTVDEMIHEVENARVYDGVHYRNSTEVGTAMGVKVGGLAVEKYLKGK